MADDSYDPFAAAKKEDIDLDNLEVDILVICKNPNVLNTSVNFLTRRGWPTVVVTDVGKGVEYIAEKRPDFVLISWSHNSQAINKLPDLITQTFNVPCIGFVETTDATSSARLAQAKIRHKIVGQPSGPSVYRTIRKILADRFEIEADEIAEGTGTAADGGVIIQKSAVGPTAGKGTQVIKGGDAPGPAPESHEGPTSLFFKKNKATSMTGDPAIDAVLDPQSEADAILAENPAQPKKARRSLKEIEGERDASGNMLFGQNLETEEQPHVTMMPTPDLINEVKKTLFGESGMEITASLPGPAPAEETAEAVTPIRPEQSLMEKAVQGAMGRFCQSIPGETIALEEITHVGVYPVDSSTHPGYLVVVWQAPEQSAREEFLRGCQHEIESGFAAMNVPGTLEPGFWVELPPVFFTGWAQNQAKFSFSFAHQKREVGIAFFQMNEPLPKPTPPAADHGMYSLKVSKISTDFPVTFKAFIHFVNNNRFFLYLRNGRKLQPEQKARLEKRNMQEFYMKQADLENVRQYMATTYLGGSVHKFKKAA